jgi:hypothetical protein
VEDDRVAELHVGEVASSDLERDVRAELALATGERHRPDGDATQGDRQPRSVGEVDVLDADLEPAGLGCRDWSSLASPSGVTPAMAGPLSFVCS